MAAGRATGLYDGPIIDPHHHLWELGHGRYPWLTTERAEEMVFGATAPLARDYRVADYLADASGQNLIASVHIEAGFDRADPVAETRWLQGQADRHGFPHGIVGYAALDEPRVEAVIERHCAYPNMRGIRFIVSWHPEPAKNFALRPDHLSDPAWRAGFALLSRYGLSFDLILYPAQMPLAVDLARTFPDQSIILNHTGSPIDRDPAGLEAWRWGMRALAGCPNVAIKISDLGAYDHDWTLESIRPFVRETIECFGPRRTMFASDFPVAGLHGSFARVYRAFRALVADLTASERRALFCDTAARLYRLDVRDGAGRGDPRD